MTERKARTDARFAREKQVLRCAQNDNQKSNGNCKSNCKSLDAKGAKLAKLREGVLGLWRGAGCYYAPEVGGSGAWVVAVGVVVRYQTRQLLAGTMGVPLAQPKAVAQPGWLTMAPLARKWSGE